jgi:hypothetical protein
LPFVYDSATRPFQRYERLVVTLVKSPGKGF